MTRLATMTACVLVLVASLGPAIYTAVVIA